MGKQMKIAGTEDPNYPDVEEAAEAYRDVRDQRMELTDKECDAKAVLHDRMKKHKLKAYRLPNSEHVAELVMTGVETVRVRKVKETDTKPARTAFKDTDEPTTAPDSTDRGDPTPETPQRRSKPKGDGTRAHADGGTTNISADLLDLKDGGAPKKRKSKGSKKHGKR